MTTLPTPRIFDPHGDKQLLHGIAEIHMFCISQDHALLRFLPPLALSKILGLWSSWSEEVEQGKRVILLQMAAESNGDRETEVKEVVAGAVSISFSSSETGRHRSEVGGLMVSPAHRYQGVARTLMQALEPIAIERGGWLVMLDTVVGSGADVMYPKLGYKEVGKIPRYGFSPQGGPMLDEVFFYKDLKHG